MISVVVESSRKILLNTTKLLVWLCLFSYADFPFFFCFLVLPKKKESSLASDINLKMGSNEAKNNGEKHNTHVYFAITFCPSKILPCFDWQIFVKVTASIFTRTALDHRKKNAFLCNKKPKPKRVVFLSLKVSYLPSDDSPRDPVNTSSDLTSLSLFKYHVSEARAQKKL